LRGYKGKLGFISHPADFEYFKNYINFLKPGKEFNDQLILKLFEWAPSYKINDFKNLSFADNDYKKADFIDCAAIIVPFIPEMRDLKLKLIKNKIEQALEIAAASSCTVISLGAFTSILMQGKEQELEEKYRFRITSGNTFTAALIIKSIENLCERFSIPLGEVTLGIVGASGDIGSGCLLHFGSKVKKLVLTARGLDSLEAIIARHKAEIKCEYILSTDNSSILKEPGIIIFATSAYKPFFYVDEFSKGTIVCDASAPLNVFVAGTPHSDVLLYHGGICQVPFEIDFGFDYGLPGASYLYGCMAEGLLHAFFNDLPHSWGRGEITQEKLGSYFKLLEGIPSLKIAYTVGNHIYTKEELDNYKERIKIN
jgi:predicted amino acid dehydrogenase